MEIVLYIKLLGVIVDEKLTKKLHIEHCMEKDYIQQQHETANNIRHQQSNSK